MTDVNLSRYQTMDIVKFGAHTVADFPDPISMGIRGNAVLSTLFVTSIDAGTTLDVEYFQTTSSTFVDGEKFASVSHEQITSGTTFPFHEQVIATRIHNKPFMEITIAGGGSVTFGVYITVNDELASDIDSALINDGDTFFQNTTKAIPIACYDEDQGKVFFIRCKDGVIPVSNEEAGDPVHLADEGTSTPGSEQTLITGVVGAGKIRKISLVRVVCRSHGRYTVTSDGAFIGSGRTGPSTPKSDFTFPRRFPIAATKDITLKFTAAAGSPTQCVDSFIMGSDVDV